MTSPNPDKTILVHYEGEPGALTIDHLTGIILTPNDERPEWSDGLAVALTAERAHFYQSRLGDAYAPPEAVEMRDLGWVAIDPETGEATEIEADADYRMDVLAAATGLSRAPDRALDTAASRAEAKIIAEAEIGMDAHRMDDEAAALNDATTASVPNAAIGR